MVSKLKRRAREVAEATPPDRNRYADFLRVTAIAMVVVGHWLVAYVTYDGEVIRGIPLLAEVPETRWLTWIFQVMPLFFFVGGMVNAISLESAKKRGEHYVGWLRRRSRRLLWPLVPLFALWLIVIAAGVWMGATGYLLTAASFTAFLPVWFLAVYVGIVAVAPLAYRLHRRLGAGAVAALFLLAVGIDVAATVGPEWIGWLNFAVVWTAIHQLGFFWYDGRLPDRSMYGVWLAVVAAAVLVVLVGMADYPISMVDTGDPTDGSNDLPPNAALLALAVFQIGVATALRNPVSRWLRRPLLWAAVATAGRRMITLFLWHMTALVAVAAAVYAPGLWPDPEPITLEWWLLRIPWLALLAAGLSVLIWAFGRFEETGPPRATSDRWPVRIRAVVGVAMVIVGLALIVTGGIYSHVREMPLGIAWWPLSMVAVGLWALGVFSRR